MSQRDYLRELEQLKILTEDGKNVVDYDQAKKIVEDVLFSQVQQIIQSIEQAMNEYSAGINNIINTETKDEY